MSKKSNQEKEDTIKLESKKEKKERKKEKEEKKRRKLEEKSKRESGTDSIDEVEAESKDSKFEEIAIDLNAGVPLSKKQQRLLKKGKLDVEKLSKKHPTPKPEGTEEDLGIEESGKSKKSEFGVWIGNLSFDTTKEDLTRFITGKTSEYKSAGESEADADLIKIEESDITRINLPKKEKKIKGFAYIDFASQKHVQTVISLSESQLNGRKLLIKDANSFEGRPNKEAVALSKNPPSRILFVGNLSFDTTQELLEEHFRHCGEIVRIRMATFEDSGKCKGFAFIDFKDESGPTTALKSKLAKKLINRPLRLEYGEDRSKRNPNQRKKQQDEEDNITQGQDEPAHNANRPTTRERVFNTTIKSTKKRVKEDYNATNKRLKSSVALATAQRSSAAIVPSEGKKIKFD